MKTKTKVVVVGVGVGNGRGFDFLNGPSAKRYGASVKLTF